jgi:outer membrane protein assembly factor BamB
MLLVLLFATRLVCAEVNFEKLGVPAAAGKFKIEGRTANTLWMGVRGSDRFGIVGVDLETKKTTWVDLAKYGRYSSLRIKCRDNKVYLYCGVKKTGFLCYDPATGKLRELGEFEPKARYTLDSVMTDGGLFVVGSYPQTKIAWLDTKTGKSGVYGRMTDNPSQCYVRTAQVDNNGIIYASVGLHHQEIWAYNPKTGSKKQIMPAEYATSKGYPELYTGSDGKVYGKTYAKKCLFVCYPDRIEYVKKIPFKAAERYKYANDEFLYLTGGGYLVAKDSSSGKTKKYKTDFRPIGPLLYSLTPYKGDTIAIGTFSPAHVVLYDPVKKKLIKDLGRKSRGRTQVYSTITVAEGMFISSYVGGYIDLLPTDNKKLKPVVSLAKTHDQERIFQLILGKDGMIYGPTMPFKGHYGGGILKLNPGTSKYDFYRNIIPEQTIRSITLVDNGLLFGGSSIAGGTSTIPKAKCAEIFLFDPQSGKVVWSGKPIAKAFRYRGVCKVADDLFFALADHENKGVFFKPSERKVTAIVDLPAKRYTSVLAGSAPDLKAAVYVLSDARVLEITPDGKYKVLGSNKAVLAKFKDALHGTHAEWVNPDGILYFGSGPDLWRVDLGLKSSKEVAAE